MTKLNQSPRDGVVALRPAGKRSNGEPHATGQFTVPSFIARRIPFGTKFRAELAEDGILFRFVSGAEEPEPAPEWVERLAAGVSGAD